MIETLPILVKVRAVRMILRVKKQDSAYLYQVLESYEGLTNFSTVVTPKELPYRDIELHMAPDLKSHLLRVLDHLKGEIPIEVID